MTTQRQAIVVYHDDWGSAAPNVRSELLNRGYTVSFTGDATVGMQALEQASTSLGPGDYLVVYLAGHGSNPRSYGDISNATALEHSVGFNSGNLKVKDLAPIFESVAQHGVNLTVIDGSCNGGETVLSAMGKPYCAVATTGVFSPSLTDFPDPSAPMHLDGTPGEFGFWWNPSHMTASWLNGAIVSAVPERINQRLFRNDDTDFARLSLFLRPSIGFLTSLDLGGWNLRYQYCYLYRFIYPNEYAALDPDEKSKFTVNLQTYLAVMHTSVDAAAPLYRRLHAYLTKVPLLQEVAKVYVARYTDVWRTLANDPAWNVLASPGQHASQMKDLTPDAYRGEPGFLRIVDEVERLMALLRVGFERQEALLKEIDLAVRGLSKAQGLPDTKTRIVQRVWPPAPGKPTLEFNSFERAMVARVAAIERELRIEPSALLHPALPETGTTPFGTSRQAREVETRKVIDRGIEAYKDSFRTDLGDKVGIAWGALDAIKRQELEVLVARFKAVSPMLNYAEGRVSFLLSIFEDALDRVENGGPIPCEVPY